jgi:uncharacterized protein YbaR (Trm112 family)
MPEIVLPCPRCQTPLLVDDDNAGAEVLCPGCRVHLVLPVELSGRVPVVEKSAAEEEVSGDGRRNFRLSRTGQAGPVEVGEAAALDPERRVGALPQKRRMEGDEERKRLAAMVGEPAAYDLHKVDTGGRTAFPCPGCHRPVWMGKGDEGQELFCEGCGSAVRAPDPAKGQAAILLGAAEGTQEREKTVLPERRQVTDLLPGEQTGAGRPKRQAGELPPLRKSGDDAPASGAKERRGMPQSASEPIPARGDAEFAAKLPPRREPAPEPPRRVTEKPSDSGGAAAGEVGPVAHAHGETAASVKTRVPRVAPERAPAFSPRHEADLSVENVGEWGGGGESAEQSPVFRRTVSLALLFLLLAGGGAAVVASRGFFAKAPASGVVAQPDGGATQNAEAAVAVLQRFFGSDTVDAMAKEVRHPDLTTDRMRRYYASQALTPRQISFATDWEEVDNFEGKGVNFIYTTVEVDSFQKRQVWLELPKDGGQPKLDWEHAVSWSEVAWSEFLTGTHEHPAEFRVTASPVHHYIGAFEDEYRYHAFRLADPEDSLNCYGYCETDSEIARQLLAECQQARRRGEVNSEGEGVARCMLRLRAVPDGKRFNQYIIDGFVWKTWVEP